MIKEIHLKLTKAFKSAKQCSKLRQRQLEHVCEYD
jgi:hypothetical protein